MDTTSPPPTFVLCHSPLVGPATWSEVGSVLLARGQQVVIPSLLTAAAASPPLWRRFAQLAAAAAPGAAAEVVLVGHSGAGQLLPQIGGLLAARVRGYLFVDAGLPDLAGPTPIAPPEFRRLLHSLASAGRLPPWSEWWGEDAMRDLLPDAELRARVTAELPSLPLAYFDEKVPPVSRWPDASCGYLWFSDPYAAAAAEARERGWPVSQLPGHHLQLVTNPGAVADGLLDLFAHP